jgi:hypothetical protein
MGSAPEYSYEAMRWLAPTKNSYHRNELTYFKDAVLPEINTSGFSKDLVRYLNGIPKDSAAKNYKHVNENYLKQMRDVHSNIYVL